MRMVRYAGLPEGNVASSGFVWGERLVAFLGFRMPGKWPNTFRFRMLVCQVVWKYEPFGFEVFI